MGRVKLVNRTPHPINLLVVVDGKEEWVEIPPTPPAVRLDEIILDEEELEVELPDGRVGKVRVVGKRFSWHGGVSPDEGEIVSALVAIYGGGLTPDTGSGAVRDEKGNIVGVTRLCRVFNP